VSQLACKDCSADFEFGAEERAFFAKKGFDPPKRCPDCRAKRRKAKPPEPTLHEVQCSACGTLTRVPFQPTAKRPVYCDDCFAYR
jgi:CxxC-x17-CxxC domain-containing protein